MKKLISFFIDRSFTVNLISFAICAVGLYVGLKIRRDLIPAFQFKQVEVTAHLPGASPEEVEKFVLFPIERSLSSLPGLKEIQSDALSQQVWMRLIFESNHKDLRNSLDEINSRIDRLKVEILPENIEELTIKQVSVDSVDFLYIGLTGAAPLDFSHREWVKSFQNAIKELPGIVQVTSSLPEPQVQISIDYEKLQNNNVSLGQVQQKVSSYLTLAPVAQFKIKDENISVQFEKISLGLDEIKSIPLYGNHTGHVLRLNDVAEVSLGIPELYERHMLDGEQQTRIAVYKDINSDAITLRNSIDEIIKSYNKQFPKELNATLIGDGSKFIEKQLSVLENNGYIGFTLVLIMLTLFVGWRAAFMAALGLPIAYLGTLITFHQFGVAIDLISVIGLIIVIGILVDDAIIVTEKYVQNIQMGMTNREAAIDSAKTLMVPITGTVLTTIVAFSPIIFIKSELSEILFSIPVVIISALLLSWFESFFILPNHLSHFVNKRGKDLRYRFFSNLRNHYERILGRTLRYRYFVLFFFIAFSGVTFWYASKHLKTNFNFHIAAQRITILASLPESTSLDQTEDAIRPILNEISVYPKDKIGLINTKIGRFWEGGQVQEGFRHAQIQLYAPDLATSTSSEMEDITKELKLKLEKYKTQFEKLTVFTSMDGAEKQKKDKVSITILGDEKLIVPEMREKIKESLSGVEGIKLVDQDSDKLQENWSFTADAKSLVQYGFSQVELGSYLSHFFDFQKMGHFYHDNNRLEVKMRVSKEFNQFEDLSDFQVTNQLGNSVPLKFLGKWEKTFKQKMIVHENGFRKVLVDYSFDPKNLDLTKAAKKIDESIAPLREQFPSFKIEVENANKKAAENKSWATQATLLCIFLIFLVLAFVLQSIVTPIFVCLAIPFGVLGIIWALILHDLELGVMAVIGLLGTAGVAVNDSLIMVDKIRKLGFADSTSNRNILIGASSRLRAIILTTITTLGGVFPMAYGIGGESGFTQPLAFAMGWGLAFSTFMTLFVLPVLLQIHLDFKFTFIKYFIAARQRLSLFRHQYVPKEVSFNHRFVNKRAKKEDLGILGRQKDSPPPL